ncbi:MAG: DNA repair protein RecO [Clostridia bacterium]|nr:DNA repair protein RecO [Clostridia bacterium]
MDLRDQNIDAIILKARDYKEQDKLLTYFSLESGKGVAVARGAMKPGGSLRNIAQPFCRVSLTLSPPRGGIAYINQGLPAASFISLDAKLEAIAYAAYISELADAAMPERRPSANFFGLLLAVFSLLKMDTDVLRTARFFELRLLAELGLLPNMAGCQECGRGLPAGNFFLSPQAGSLLCQGCGGADAAPRLSAGAVQTMRQLAAQPFSRIPSIKISAAIMAEMEQALGYFLDYHLEYSPKARRILRQLLD